MTKKNQPGCDCCGPPCDNCTTTVTEIEVSISGIAAGTFCSPGACTDFNDTFSLTIDANNPCCASIQLNTCKFISFSQAGIILHYTSTEVHLAIYDWVFGQQVAPPGGDRCAFGEYVYQTDVIDPEDQDCATWLDGYNMSSFTSLTSPSTARCDFSGMQASFSVVAST